MHAGWKTALVLGFAAVAGQASSNDLAARQPHLTLTDGTAHVNGVDVFYRRGGSGPPVLMIHGFTKVGHDWDRFLDVFGQHHTVIVPDLRGHGRSTNPAGEFSYQESARDMFALLDHLGIQILEGIGHSAGGITLLHMAVQQPRRVDAMVLVAADHRLTPQDREVLRTLPGLEEFPTPQQEAYRAIHEKGDPQIRSLLSCLRALGDSYVDLTPEDLAAVPTRTLVVWGDRDPHLPLEHALELYRSLPEAALWVIPGEGHFGIWGSDTAAHVFQTLAMEFLSGKGPE